MRFVSATNRSLKDMVDAGEFRDDLFFRVRGAEIHVPPLRERKEDIPLLLVNHAVARYAVDSGVERPTITQPGDDALDLLRVAGERS